MKSPQPSKLTPGVMPEVGTTVVYRDGKTGKQHVARIVAHHFGFVEAVDARTTVGGSRVALVEADILSAL